MIKKTFLSIFIIFIFGVGCKASAKIPSVSQKLISVCINNKWGLIDKSGKQIIPFKYDDAIVFSEGLAPVCINNKCGYIDKAGKEVIPLRYDITFDFSEGFANVLKNDKSGYINNLGKQITPFKYDALTRFSEGLASVCVNGKCGYIDKTGKEVIPLIYSRPKTYWEGLSPNNSVSSENYSDGLAPVCKNIDKGVEKCGYVNKNNEIKIPFKYSDVTSFKNGFAAVRAAGSWGLINSDGKEIVPLNYTYFDLPKEGLIGACMVSGSSDKCGFINTKNKVMIPFKYRGVEGFTNGLAQVIDENKIPFFINKKGEKVLDLRAYQSVGKFSDGLAIACKTFDKFGFIDKKGKVVVPLKYEAVSDFKNGIAAVLVGGIEKWGFIDKTGKMVIQPKYDWTGLVF